MWRTHSPLSLTGDRKAQLSVGTMGSPIPEWFDPTQVRDGDGRRLGGLRPSEVVHQTIPDPAEQAPLVARSVTPPSPSGRGGTTLLSQRAPRSCTVFVMTPPDEHISEGGRDDRGVPYHAESTLSSAQVLNRAPAPDHCSLYP